jgi:hypothetical protein
MQIVAEIGRVIDAFIMASLFFSALAGLAVLVVCIIEYNRYRLMKFYGDPRALKLEENAEKIRMGYWEGERHESPEDVYRLRTDSRGLHRACRLGNVRRQLEADHSYVPLPEGVLRQLVQTESDIPQDFRVYVGRKSVGSWPQDKKGGGVDGTFALSVRTSVVWNNHSTEGGDGMSRPKDRIRYADVLTKVGSRMKRTAILAFGTCPKGTTHKAKGTSRNHAKVNVQASIRNCNCCSQAEPVQATA